MGIWHWFRFRGRIGLARLQARETYTAAHLLSELEREKLAYRYCTRINHPVMLRTPTSSNIYQVQSTKFTLYLLWHARTFMRCHASTLQQPHNRFTNVGIHLDIFKQEVVTKEGNSFNIHGFLSHVYCYVSKHFIMIKELHFYNILCTLTRLTLIFMQITD